MRFFSVKSAVKHILVLELLASTLVSVPPAEAIASRQLVEIADFNSPVVSRDGGSVAFRIEQASIERNTYDTVWYVQSMDGKSPPRRVADGGVPLRDSAGVSVPAVPQWSPDGRWIYYRALVEGRVDVWRAATDGSGAEPVTLDHADIRDFSLGVDGTELRYSIGATREDVISAEEAEYARGIRIDESAPVGQNLFRSGYIEGRPATQRLGLMFNRVALKAGVPDRWKAINMDTREKRDLAPSEIPSAPLARLDISSRSQKPWKLEHDSHSDRVALLTRTGDGENLHLKPDVELSALLGGKSRRPIRCRAEQCIKKEITGIQWRPGSDEVIFTVTDSSEGYAQSIFRWNVETGAVRPVAASRGMFAGERRWRPGTCGLSSAALACVAADASGPPRLERIDLDTGDRQVLFDPNAALARDMDEIPAQLLRWADAEGRQFTGQLYRAKRTGNGPPPLFVTYYRCFGFLRGGSGDEWPLAELAEQGVTTLCINAAPLQIDAAERYDMGRSAVESAIELLASQGAIDRTKVGMGGLSFGTEVTWWTLIHSDLISAASVASPAISQHYLLLGSNMGDEFISNLRGNWQLGGLDETPERWQQMSPTSNLHNIHSPILMQLPEQEFIHTLDYAIPLMRGNRADVYVFPYEPHNKFQPRHKLAVYQRNLDWFRFWLLGLEDGNPMKKEQYLNWRMMQSSMGAVGAN